MADQREHWNLALNKKEEEEEAKPEHLELVEKQQVGEEGEEEEEEGEADGLDMRERMQKRGQTKSFLAIWSIRQFIPSSLQCLFFYQSTIILPLKVRFIAEYFRRSEEEAEVFQGDIPNYIVISFAL